MSSSRKDQKILLNSVKLWTKKLLLNMSLLDEKGAFWAKCVLDFILLTSIHSKCMKSKPTCVPTFNEDWPILQKFFYNKKFWFLWNFVPFHLVHDWNLSLFINIDYTYVLPKNVAIVNEPLSREPLLKGKAQYHWPPH